MTSFQKVSDIVEANGSTIRENNMRRTHKLPLGALVEVPKLYCTARGNEEAKNEPYVPPRVGPARLYVVGHMRDCDGEPLYVLSDIPVIYPMKELTFSTACIHYRAFSSIISTGVSEEDLVQVGEKKLHESFREYFGV